jgi:hypothetical protein
MLMPVRAPVQVQVPQRKPRPAQEMLVQAPVRAPVQVQVPQRKPRPAQEMLVQAPVPVPVLVQLHSLSVRAPVRVQASACHRNLLQSRQQVSMSQCASRGQSRF